MVYFSISFAFCFCFDKVQFTDGKECDAIKELYKVLKDHKNSFMQDLVRNSYEKNYSRELRGAFGQDTSVSQYAEDCGSENVVRVALFELLLLL